MFLTCPCDTITKAHCVKSIPKCHMDIIIKLNERKKKANALNLIYNDCQSKLPADKKFLETLKLESFTCIFIDHPSDGKSVMRVDLLESRRKAKVLT